MKIIAIIFSISIVFCQNEDLVDDRLSWLLTNPDNIDKLDEDKSKIIKSELSKILEKFNNEVKDKNIFTPTTSRERNPTSYETIFDESAYLTHLLAMNNPTQMEADYLKSLYTTIIYHTKDAIKRKGFNVYKVELSMQIPEWSDIVEYYGGYSELTGIGIKKEDLERFRVTKFLKRVEIGDENQCIAIIETEAEKDYGLKFYALDGKQQIIYGIYQLDDFTITDLYYLAQDKKGSDSPERAISSIMNKQLQLEFNLDSLIQSYVTQRLMKSLVWSAEKVQEIKSLELEIQNFQAQNVGMATVPEIEFKFIDQELVQTKHSIFTKPGVIIKPVDKINKEIIDLSKTYFSTIEMMINDIVPLRYYNTFSHRKELIKKQRIKFFESFQNIDN